MPYDTRTDTVSVPRCCRCCSKISRFQISSFLRNCTFYLQHLQQAIVWVKKHTCRRCRSKISRFQIFSFLREFSFYLRHLRHCADQRNPWSRWSSKKRLFLEKLFFKRVRYLPAPAAPPKGRNQKTPLGQMWQQEMVVFRKALF